MSLLKDSSGTAGVTYQGLSGRIEIIEEAPLNGKADPYNLVGDGSDETTALASFFSDLATRKKGFLGPGNFRTASPIALTADGIQLQGAGRESIGSNHTKIYSSSGGVFTVSGTQHLSLSDMVIQAAGTGASAGHVFEATGSCDGSTFERLLVAQAATGKSIWTQDTNDKPYIDNTWRDCYLQHVASATVPAFYLNDATSCLNRNTWENLRCTYSGNFFFHIECEDAANYQYDNVFRDINFEVCDGGCIKGLSVNTTLIENCTAYDLSAATTKDLFYIGASTTGGFRSIGTTFRNVTRRGGSLGVGLSDIKLETNQARFNILDQCRTAALTGFVVDLGGNDATIRDCHVNTLSNITVGRVFQFGGSAANTTLYGPLVMGSASVPGAAGIYVEGFEQSSDPSAPAANGFRLYAKDVGGKTALFARFNTGAVQQIAIEP